MLSGTTRALLSACVEPIVARDRTARLNLFPMSSDRNSTGDEAVTYLAREVEKYTDGKRTIRPADPALFEEHGSGRSMLVVACSTNTPPGIVTELEPDMVLVDIGPYSNGFHVDAPRATPQQVQEYRDLIAQSKRDSEERDQIRQEAAVFMTWLTELVRRHARDRGELQLAREIGARSNLTVDDLAGYCHKLGTSLLQMVALT